MDKQATRLVCGISDLQLQDPIVDLTWSITSLYRIEVLQQICDCVRVVLFELNLSPSALLQVA